MPLAQEPLEGYELVLLLLCCNVLYLMVASGGGEVARWRGGEGRLLARLFPAHREGLPVDPWQTRAQAPHCWIDHLEQPALDLRAFLR